MADPILIDSVTLWDTTSYDPVTIAPNDPVAEGSLVVIVVFDDWLVSSPPDGFIEMGDPIVQLIDESGTGREMIAWYKVAGDSEPESYEFSLNNPIVMAQLRVYDLGDWTISETGTHGPAEVDLYPDSAVAPPNNAFADALEVTGANGASARYTIDAATRETDEPIEGRFQTLWWSWTAPSTDSITFDLAPSRDDDGNPLDTVIAIFTGGPGLADLSFVDGNDDADDVTSRVTLSPSMGETYSIQVGCFSSGSTGSVVLRWYPDTVPPIVREDDWSNVFVEGAGDLLLDFDIEGHTEDNPLTGQAVLMVRAAGVLAGWGFGGPDPGPEGPTLEDESGSESPGTNVVEGNGDIFETRYTLRVDDLFDSSGDGDVGDLHQEWTFAWDPGDTGRDIAGLLGRFVIALDPVEPPDDIPDDVPDNDCGGFGDLIFDAEEDAPVFDPDIEDWMDVDAEDEEVNVG